jgi:hypothetical protein
MKIDKQKAVLDILATGRYKVIDNDVYAVRKSGLHRLVGTTLPSGYRQHILFNGVRYGNGIKVVVYQHILTYIATHGIYEEGLVIDHIDKDTTNNCIDNLRAIPQRYNINPAKTYTTRMANEQGIKKIRGNEIKDIRELMEQGHSQASIARILDLNRLSVRYIYNNIKKGLPLKYENYFRQ